MDLDLFMQIWNKIYYLSNYLIREKKQHQVGQTYKPIS